MNQTRSLKFLQGAVDPVFATVQGLTEAAPAHLVIRERQPEYGKSAAHSFAVGKRSEIVNKKAGRSHRDHCVRIDREAQKHQSSDGRGQFNSL